MESSTKASSGFRFRDHHQSEDATDSDTSSEINSAPGDEDEDSELESMTGKGIKRLCMEFMEIKEASDEDFHGNISANYLAFLGILEEVKDVEKELMQLRTHVQMQKMLVKNLIDGVYLRALSVETMDSILRCDIESSPKQDLEVHIANVSETLDMLLFENRTDEVIAILENEEENLNKLQLEDDDTSQDVLILYNNAISERKAMVTLQLTLVAENSRISSSELQKALVGICRLGDNPLATQLLLKHYHSRIASEIQYLQSAKSTVQGMYIRELSRSTFSLISQAARSFLMLHGETSAYGSEFFQWIREEIEMFAITFTKYVKSISEISSGLSVAVEAMQYATSYCALLEAQRLMLQPLLIEHLRTCMEDVLARHIDHFKKVLNIFTATDAWVLGRYLVSGILNEGYSYIVVGQQPEYCLLTNSGRKFVTLLQAISKDVTPLASLQMEGSILAGLGDLFIEYIAILEEAITCDVKASEKSSCGVILAESLPQQVSILANLLTLEHFFSGTVTSMFRGLNRIDSEQRKSHSVGIQQQELDNYIMMIQEASAQLRAQFFQKFIDMICKLATEMCVDSESAGSQPVHVPRPSSIFQVLFLELRKLNKLFEDNVFEEDWLLGLIRDLIKAIFAWISNNKNIWEPDTGELNFQHPGISNQFVLDMHFLVEAIKYGEYFSKDPLVPAVLMNAAFNSAGLDPLRDVDDDGWAMKAATEAIERLREMEKAVVLSNDDEVVDISEPSENHSEHASETFQDAVRSSLDSEEDVEQTKVVTLIKKLTDLGCSSDAEKEEGFSVNMSGAHQTDISRHLEDAETDNAS